MMVRAFIQARMGSRRFPGKVLAPFRGRPLVAQVLERVERAVPRALIVVTTSLEPADDPLASYVRDLGIAVFRGSLENVAERFQDCLGAYPCSWFFRVCADSPLLDPTLLQAMLLHCHRSDVDLVTNVYPRTFPRGQSVEMLRAQTFAALDSSRLTPEQKEHVTRVYYEHPEAFRILSLCSADPRLAERNLAVDRVEDLKRLERVEVPPAGLVGMWTFLNGGKEGPNA